jgi:hypothetical protein
MKSLEVKFAEAMEAIKKAGHTKQFDEKAKGCTTIESKLNAAEAILKSKGIVPAEGFRVQPTRKNNGAADRYVENNPLGLTAQEFRESSNSFSPGYVQETTNPCAKGDKVMFDGLLKLGKITEAEHRKMTGAKPEGYEKLTEAQRKEFDFARAIGISESDAFKVVTITGSTFKEVSRR